MRHEVMKFLFVESSAVSIEFPVPFQACLFGGRIVPTWNMMVDHVVHHQHPIVQLSFVKISSSTRVNLSRPGAQQPRQLHRAKFKLLALPTIFGRPRAHVPRHTRPSRLTPPPSPSQTLGR